MLAKKLQTVMQLLFPVVLQKQALPYMGRDMKVGINANKLEELGEFLYSFMEIDPRGGYFRQCDIEAAWHAAADEANVKEALLIIAQVNRKKYQDWVIDASYCVRAMLSHTREKIVLGHRARLHSRNIRSF